MFRLTKHLHIVYAKYHIITSASLPLRKSLTEHCQLMKHWCLCHLTDYAIRIYENWRQRNNLDHWINEKLKNITIDNRNKHLNWFFKKKSYQIYFFKTFYKCVLPMLVSKNTIKKIDHPAWSRDLIGQSYPIYACTLCGHWKYGFLK